VADIDSSKKRCQALNSGFMITNIPLLVLVGCARFYQELIQEMEWLSQMELSSYILSEATVPE